MMNDCKNQRHFGHLLGLILALVVGMGLPVDVCAKIIVTKTKTTVSTRGRQPDTQTSANPLTLEAHGHEVLIKTDASGNTLVYVNEDNLSTSFEQDKYLAEIDGQYSWGDVIIRGTNKVTMTNGVVYAVYLGVGSGTSHTGANASFKMSDGSVGYILGGGISGDFDIDINGGMFKSIEIEESLAPRTSLFINNAVTILTDDDWINVPLTSLKWSLVPKAGNGRIMEARGTNPMVLHTVSCMELHQYSASLTANQFIHIGKCNGYVRNGVVVGEDELTDAEWLIDVAPHEKEEYVSIQPSCTSDGSYVSKCHACNKSMAPSASLQYEATGHTVVDEGANSKFCHLVKTGAAHCGDCGKRLSAGLTNTHTFEARTVTCGGYTNFYNVCTVCNWVEYTGVGSPRHAVRRTITTVAPTCTKYGYDRTVCPGCKVVTYGNLTEPTAHTLTHHQAVAATCTTRGTKEYWSCDVCGWLFRSSTGTLSATIDEVIRTPKLGHRFAHYATAECKASYNECTESPTYTPKCSRCGQLNELGHTFQTSANPLGHDFRIMSIDTKDAYDTYSGSLTLRCHRCLLKKKGFRFSIFEQIGEDDGSGTFKGYWYKNTLTSIDGFPSMSNPTVPATYELVLNYRGQRMSTTYTHVAPVVMQLEDFDDVDENGHSVKAGGDYLGFSISRLDAVLKCTNNAVYTTFYDPEDPSKALKEVRMVFRAFENNDEGHARLLSVAQNLDNDHVVETYTDLKLTHEAGAAPSFLIPDNPARLSYNMHGHRYLFNDKEVYDLDEDRTFQNVRYQRNFTNTEWQSIYLPFTISGSALANAGLEVASPNKLLTADTDHDGTPDCVYVNLENMALYPRLQPALVRASETGNVTIDFASLSLRAAQEHTASTLTSQNRDLDMTLHGTFLGVSGSDMFANGYWAMSGGSFMQASSSAVNLAPQRVFVDLTWPDGTSANDVLAAAQWRMVFDDDDVMQTAIDQILPASQRQHAVYGIDGVRVANPDAPLSKGMYVVNGKKFVIK